MAGILDILRGTFAPELSSLGLLADFAKQRQDFASQRLQGLLSTNWNPMTWQWPAPDMQAKMTPELEARARAGMANAVGDVYGEGISGGSLAGILAGPKGAARVAGKLDDLARAKAMAEQGVQDADIWKQTGWWVRTPDGVPRWEIPDAPSRYGQADTVTGPENWRDISSGTLPDYMQHEGLYQAYPELASMPVRVADIGSDLKAMVDRSGITLNPQYDDALTQLLHEVQHLIQEAEGMAVGGQILQTRDSYAGLKALDDYLNLAGEAEARAVTLRALNNYLEDLPFRGPWRDYDVPLESLIIPR